MPSPREDSECFAVHALRRRLAASRRPDGHPAGTVKDFVVEKHLDVFMKNGPLRRNFTFWWRWTRPSGVVKWKKVPGTTRRATRGRRTNEWMLSPFEGRKVQVVRVAVMIKCRRQSTALMQDMVADHNNGIGGWHTADWRLLRAIDADADDDRGWWVL